eukprot:12414565-Karenia_brevis.AAC.1
MSSPCSQGHGEGEEHQFDDPADELNDLASPVPLDRQEEVDHEAATWAEVWQAGEVPPPCPWPAEMGRHLP